MDQHRSMTDSELGMTFLKGFVLAVAGMFATGVVISLFL